MASKQYRIGYALSPKKEKTAITPSLLDYAKQHGLNFVRIDPHASLLHQGLFDCIIHKVDASNDDDWIRHLRDFQSIHQEVLVIDPPESIARLHNRATMLDVVKEVEITSCRKDKVEIPKQIVIHDSEGETLSKICSSLELTFPVIAKQVEANGSSNAHDMKVVFNENGLKELKAPIVLQEFVNHGGVVYKAYVLGEHVTCVKRESLPDVSEEKKMEKSDDVLSFSRISNSATENRGEEGGDDDEGELPCMSFVKELARGLRKKLGLRLFNFDLIRDVRDVNRYLVIDINYFPGYAKMPSYEPVFTDFLLDVVTKRGVLDE